MLKDVQGRVPRGGTADPEGEESEGDGDGGEDGDGGKRGLEVLGSTVLSSEVLDAWRKGCEVRFALYLLFLEMLWDVGGGEWRG